MDFTQPVSDVEGGVTMFSRDIEGLVVSVNYGPTKSAKHVLVIVAKPATTTTTTPAEPEENDCAIVATEMFHRLQPNAYWVNIMAIENPRGIGHAVVEWKVTASSKVMAYDSTGTVELDTVSTNVDMVAAACRQIQHLPSDMTGKFLE